MNSQKSPLFLAKLAAPRKAKLRKQRLVEMEKREEDRQRILNDPRNKPVVGFEDFYMASEEGFIVSLWHNRLLQSSTSKRGYLFVALRGNRKGQFQVHRLVCEAFHGSSPTSLHVVNHKNGIKADNRPSNLEWVTRSENTTHAYQTGLIRSGERSHLAKLTDAQANEIRAMGRTKSQAKIGAMFGVSQTCIGKILNNKKRKHQNHE